MIVLDASALLELLLATPTGLAVAERIADPADSLDGRLARAPGVTCRVEVVKVT